MNAQDAPAFIVNAVHAFAVRQLMEAHSLCQDLPIKIELEEKIKGLLQNLNP